jgi:hypothetical protein
MHRCAAFSLPVYQGDASGRSATCIVGTSLLDEGLEPPLGRIGCLQVDDFLALVDRKNLAAALNTLLASPTFRAGDKAPPSIEDPGRSIERTAVKPIERLA